MADHVPVYHFNVNAEAQYVVFAAGIMGGSIYEMYNAWEPRDNITIFFHLFLFLIASFYFARHLPFMLRTEFLRLNGGGITFRGLGFVPWQSIQKIGSHNDGLVFQFTSPETIRVTNNYFRRVRYRDNLVLMILRTSKISLDASTAEIVRDLILQYAAYLAPTRNFNQNTSPKEVLSRIEEEKRGIKFFEKYEDILAEFNT